MNHNLLLDQGFSYKEIAAILFLSLALTSYVEGWRHEKMSCTEENGDEPLFLFGNRDIKYQSIRNRLMKLGIKTELIPNSGHTVHVENPKVCA